MARVELVLGAAVAVIMVMTTNAQEEAGQVLIPDCLPQRCPLWSLLPCERYKRDENGCPTCECQCYKLAPLCPYDCKYGTEYVTNANGCKVCQCAEKVTTCGPVCKNYCPWGRVLDANNCPTCKCLDPPPIFNVCGDVCDIHCEFGNVLDERGCPTCNCKSGPVTDFF